MAIGTGIQKKLVRILQMWWPWSDGFFRSGLIWVCMVCLGLYVRQLALEILEFLPYFTFVYFVEKLFKYVRLKSQPKPVCPTNWANPINWAMLLMNWPHLWNLPNWWVFQTGFTKWLHLYFLYVYLCRGYKFHSSARNYEWKLERTSNSSQSTHPTGPVLWEELLVLSCFTLKSEGEMSIFWVLTMKSFCQYMGCNYEFDSVNVILTVI